jgi:hypothetical protein
MEAPRAPAQAQPAAPAPRAAMPMRPPAQREVPREVQREQREQQRDQQREVQRSREAEGRARTPESRGNGGRNQMQ